MKTKLIWRLGKLPTPTELSNLVNDKIITQEEAREILFSSETEEDRDKKSLESEIKFLRDLVEKLSNGSQTRVVEVIKEVYKPYYQYHWYQPYQVWCSGTAGLTSNSTAGCLGGAGTIQNTSGGGVNSASSLQVGSNNTAGSSFSSIKTF